MFSDVAPHSSVSKPQGKENSRVLFCWTKIEGSLISFCILYLRHNQKGNII